MTDIEEEVMRLLKERGIEPVFPKDEIFVTIGERGEYYYGIIDAAVRTKKKI